MIDFGFRARQWEVICDIGAFDLYTVYTCLYNIHLLHLSIINIVMVMPQQQDSSEAFGDTLTRLPKATIQVHLKPWASALYILRADHLGQIVV